MLSFLFSRHTAYSIFCFLLGVHGGDISFFCPLIFSYTQVTLALTALRLPACRRAVVKCMPDLSPPFVPFGFYFAYVYTRYVGFEKTLHLHTFIYICKQGSRRRFIYTYIYASRETIRGQVNSGLSGITTYL